MPLAWYALMALLALRPEYRPDACERVFSSDANKQACIDRQEEGYAWAVEVSGWYQEEAIRWGFTTPIDIIWAVADAMKESGLSRQDNMCLKSLQVERIVERTELEAATETKPARYRLCWTYSENRRNCQVVWLLAEDDERVYLDTCAAGEVGPYQLLSNQIPGRSETDVNGDGEITRADGGYVLPWGETLSTSLAVRRTQARDWRVGIHLGLRVLREERDRCCSEDAECAASWEWLGAHKMGVCESELGDAYVRRTREYVDTSIAYLCQQMPLDLLCVPQN